MAASWQHRPCGRLPMDAVVFDFDEIYVLLDRDDRLGNAARNHVADARIVPGVGGDERARLIFGLECVGNAVPIGLFKTC